MLTYQDLQENLNDITGFMKKAINEYKSTDIYKTAVIAEQYARMKNVSINEYKKILYRVTGEAVIDSYSANHKCASNFFNIFITQEVQYLLGNGALFEDEKTKEKLGGAKFDRQLQKAGLKSLIGGVAYGFLSVDNVDVFGADEFVPLWDEENGSLRAGIRFWQIDATKPLRTTLYEEDGYTEYLLKESEWTVLKEKSPYIYIVKESIADGVTIYDGENYPSLPVVPLWGNEYHQSALVGLRENIDAYDLIKSGFANDLDDASLIYWILSNAGGMDDIDLAKFVERLKVVKAGVLDDDVKAEAHTIDVPYQSREAYLSRLESDLYNDAMALNERQLTSNVTATAIKASYMGLDKKADNFEYNVIDFINGLLELLGLEDAPTFKRSKVVNEAEETQMILSAGQYLDDETILKHLPFLSPDEIEGIIERKEQEQLDRYEDAEPLEEEQAEQTEQIEQVENVDEIQ